MLPVKVAVVRCQNGLEVGDHMVNPEAEAKFRLIVESFFILAWELKNPTPNLLIGSDFLINFFYYPPPFKKILISISFLHPFEGRTVA